jgi:hypothetical protein
MSNELSIVIDGPMMIDIGKRIIKIFLPFPDRPHIGKCAIEINCLDGDARFEAIRGLLNGDALNAAKIEIKIIPVTPKAFYHQDDAFKGHAGNCGIRTGHLCNCWWQPNSGG